MDLRQMARALGGNVVKGQVLAPGPRHSPADRSLAVRPSATSPYGFVAHSHAGDDWRECRDHVLQKLGYRPGDNHARPHQHVDRDRHQHGGETGDRALELWKEAGEPRGTLVERYLASRSLELPDDIASSVIRFHRACPWRDEHDRIVRVPAMLTLFRRIDDDKPVAIHRTALTPDGVKIGRMMLGPVGGAAIKIDPDENVTMGLAIGEGFETCLAARQLGFRPVWALGSAGAIGRFPVLAGIEALTIFAETDKTGVNKRAIATCGQRWSEAGLEVNVVAPKNGGDVNDALRGRTEA